LDVALGETPGFTPGVEPGAALGVVLDTKPAPTPTLDPGNTLGVVLGNTTHERLQRFKFYRAILPYLVMFGTILPPPKGNAKEYVGCYTNALQCPVRPFDWSPFPYYLRYQFTWSVFPDWAFPFDKRHWKLLSTGHQQQLHVIFGVIFGCTNMYDLWAPDFP
jgi:hypothetical protein